GPPRADRGLRARRRAQGARARLQHPHRALRVHRQGRLARRTQGRAPRALLRPRAIPPRAQEHPPRALPARLPVPAQLAPCRDLGPPSMAALILVAGLDSRSLFLEAPVLMRDRGMLEEKPSARELLDSLARQGGRLVILGTRLPDVGIQEAVRRIR